MKIDFSLEGEALLEQIEKAIQEDEKKIKQIEKFIKKGSKTFKHKNSDREGILHPCTEKTYSMQFSFFDSIGAIGDFRRNTIQEIAKSIFEYGYEPCEESDLTILF